MRKHLPLLAICLGYFMVILDATIVNVALRRSGVSSAAASVRCNG